MVTTVLYLSALVLLADHFLILKSGSLLAATFTLPIPWAVVVGVNEYLRRQLAKTVLRNLAANGKPVGELPTFAEPQFLRWKRDHGVTTDDLQSSAPPRLTTSRGIGVSRLAEQRDGRKLTSRAQDGG